jgi:lipoprotein-releasing system permease protein
MIISFQILQGFQEKIRDKIISFGGHLQVTKFNLSQSYEEEPISINAAIFTDYQKYRFIDHVQAYAHKAGLLKANEEVMGILLKGVTPNYDTARFSPYLVEGRFITFNDSTNSEDLIISRQISQKLQLNVGDDALVYFIQNPVRIRRLNICGIYETGLEDFDEKMVLADLELIQKINNWPDTLIGGFEVFVKDFKSLDRDQEKLYDIVSYDHYVEKISDKYVEIFDWLNLLNRNVVIFLTITLVVACFNMVSILLILIMERTQMIGTLKALGAQNKQIKRIFVYHGMQLIWKGLVLGNIIGIGFGILQQKFQLLKLDPQTYYMEFVPIFWNWGIIILLNLMIFSIVSVVLLLPSIIISRISPIKSIRFD